MEVKIGVQHANRELTLESDKSSDDVQQTVADAVDKGGLLALTDTKGRRILVPADKLAYVEVSSGSAGTVGFRS